MGRRLSDERRSRVVADLAGRLQHVLPRIATPSPSATEMATRTLQLVLNGGAVPVLDPVDGLLLVAVEALDIARGPEAPPDAMNAWVDRYLDPSSATNLSGAKRLWTRAVNLERDRARRAAGQAVGVPARITLAPKHRHQLNELQQKYPGEPAARLAGLAIEQQHHRATARKSVRSSLVQPKLDL